jgi:serine protease Do
VTRGFLGVSIQNLNDDIASSLGLDTARGSLVTEPRPDSPAQEAGIRSGDVILSVEGQQIDDSRDLSRTIAGYNPGTTVNLTIWRDGSEQTVAVTLGQLSEEAALTQNEEAPAPAKPEPQTTSTGLTLLPNDRGDGAVIAEVAPDSIAAEKGFAAGDVILEANNTAISSAEDFDAAVQAVLSAGRDTILVKLSRNGDVRFVGLPVSNAG